MANRPKINHNVYILGAGFSVDGGIPLVKDFLQRMADSVEWLYKEGREREAEAVNNVFSFRLRAAGAAYRAQIDVENIEELFSLASASEGEALTKDITTAIAATIDFARASTPTSECKVGSRIVHGDDGSWNKEEEQVPTYHLYAGLISGSMCAESAEMRNTVITFNYDTLLDDALSELKIPFTYGLPSTVADYRSSSKSSSLRSAQALKVYKLHGSINWSTLSKSNSKIKVYGGYQDVPAHERVLLIPPTWRKVFGGHLSDIWSKAVEALSEATRIIVVGFSMPSTDTHFKYLLAAGLQNNISLRKFLFVNPGLRNDKEKERLCSNLYSILRHELEDRGIIELLGLRTSEFFLSRNYGSAISRKYVSELLDIHYPGKERIEIYQ